jgi:hypothetical protein
LLIPNEGSGLKIFCSKIDKRSVVQISVHLKQMGKLVHSERAERFFGTFKMGGKVFLECKRTKRPKTEARRAFEILSAHFGCAENLSIHSKKDRVLQMN